MTTVLGPSTPTPIFEALNKANDRIDRAVFNLEMLAKTRQLVRSWKLKAPASVSGR